MKTVILILSIAFLAACNATYKTGQTPDDLYYSKPKVEKREYVQYDRETTVEDRQIRMGINNPRWRSLDYNYDYDYRYHPYAFGYGYGYYYNPCYYPYPVYNIRTTFTNPKNTTIRKSNLGGYGNTVTNYQPVKFGTQGNSTNIRRVYNNIRNSNNNQYNNRTSDADSRNYSPSPSNNSGNSGGSAAPSGNTVTRPGRGG